MKESLDEFNKLMNINQTPDQTFIHRWMYSDLKNYTQLGDGFLYDSNNNIGFCGDWCNAGRVEGAYLSGYKLGEKLI